ncbi:Ca2+-binding protein, RTX toxin [Rickettsiales bacterium Ac37b]|nr:Ca2+-binding protein, RTX toxin [Rickettsiales bacterium Ac37b]
MLITNEYVGQVNVAKKELNKLKELLEQEANGLYSYFVAELPKLVAQEKNKKEEISDEEFVDFNELTNQFVLTQRNQTILNSEVKINPETLFMPMMRGYGELPSFHIAMSENANLKALVEEFITLGLDSLDYIQTKIMNIVYEWAGVTHIDENARIAAGGANIEARKVAFVEQLTGQAFRQLGAAKFVGQHASTSIQKVWDTALIRISKNLLVQGPMMEIFAKAEYFFDNDNIMLNTNFAETIAILQNWKGKLSYSTWVQIGYILATSTQELGISIEEIKAKLSELAGEAIMLNSGMFGLIGDDFDNIIKGTSGSDYIKGLKGNDKLYGSDASDHLEGDEGDDELYGDSGNDHIYGEKGDDHIEGGEGADYMDGGEGENTLSYGDSPVGVKIHLAKGEANYGHAEGDNFKNFQNIGGSEFNDHLTGDEKDNYINGEGGDDEIHGAEGDDDLFGAKGHDALYGEEGDDTLSGFEGIDNMDGGEGVDTASYHHPYATVGVNVDLARGYGIGGYASGDTYQNIENVVGSKFNDVIKGNAENNLLKGMEGNDLLYGEAGDDKLVGGSGENKIFAGAGNDYILTGIGADEIDGGEGEDTISYEYASSGAVVNMKLGMSITGIDQNNFINIENVIGSEHNDQINGDYKDNKLYGLGGNDVIEAGAGNDIIAPGEGDDKAFGEDGDDYFLGDLGADEIDGGKGKDTVDYSKSFEGIKINLAKNITSGGIAAGDKLYNIENIVGTNFADNLIGDDHDNQLHGMGGDDKICGGKGNDIISGGKGKNQLYGEEGNDLFLLHEGINNVIGGEGYNTADYSKASAGVNINLAEKQGKKSTGEIDSFVDIKGTIGSNYDDIIIGDEEDNILSGNAGNDYINGGEWHDTISGGEGNNTLVGEGGNDIFLVSAGSNDIDGGNGVDTINYSNLREDEYKLIIEKELEMRSSNQSLPTYALQQFNEPVLSDTKGLKIDLNLGYVEKSEGYDIFTNVENIVGSHYDDIIIGDKQNNILDGFDGDDEIHGGEGNDMLIARRGKSKLYGDEGDDTFKVIAGTADIYGGIGHNSIDLILYNLPAQVNLDKKYIIYGEHVANMLENITDVRGTAYNDVIYDNHETNIIAAGNGDDEIYLTDGDDSVNSEKGDDRIYLGGIGKKQIWGGFGKDTYIITPKYSSTADNKTIIVDFEYQTPTDKIDVSQFPAIHSIEDLSIEQIYDNDIMYANIKISEDKEIRLFDVKVFDLTAAHFIFTDH